MRIVIIGATGHGKSTLAKAIEQLSGIKYEEKNSQGLIEHAREKIEYEKELLEMDKGLISETKKIKNSHRKKGKEIKPWQKTRFYQK